MHLVPSGKLKSSTLFTVHRKQTTPAAITDLNLQLAGRQEFTLVKSRIRRCTLRIGQRGGVASRGRKRTQGEQIKEYHEKMFNINSRRGCTLVDFTLYRWSKDRSAPLYRIVILVIYSTAY